MATVDPALCPNCQLGAAGLKGSHTVVKCDTCKWQWRIDVYCGSCGGRQCLVKTSPAPWEGVNTGSLVYKCDPCEELRYMEAIQ